MEEVISLKARLIIGIVIGTFGVLSLAASACTFQFNYAAIEAPIGTVGEVGVRVQKTHNNCTLSSMDDYRLEGSGIQILGATAWEDLGGGLYEKWLQISLSQVGEGSLKISKTCTKEGYQEKILPVTTLTSEASDAVWSQAWNGIYPLEATENVISDTGTPAVLEGTLTVGSLTVTLPQDVQLPDSLPLTVRLYAVDSRGDTAPLLLVGEDMFFRFDHLAH